MVPNKLLKNKYKPKIEKLCPSYYGPNKSIEEELIAIGQPVVPSLIAALEHFTEWLALTREMNERHPQEHLDWQERTFSTALSSVARILEGITAQQFGTNYQAWQAWWGQEIS